MSKAAQRIPNDYAALLAEVRERVRAASMMLSRRDQSSKLSHASRRAKWSVGKVTIFL